MITETLSVVKNLVQFILEWKDAHAEVSEQIESLHITVVSLSGTVEKIHPYIEKLQNLQGPLKSIADCLTHIKRILIGTHKLFDNLTKFLFPKNTRDKLQKAEDQLFKLVQILHFGITVQNTVILSDSNKLVKEMKNVSLKEKGKGKEAENQSFAPEEEEEQAFESQSEEREAPSALDLFHDSQTKEFWKKSFGERVFDVTIKSMTEALVSKFKDILDEPAVEDLMVRLDNFKTGNVTCYNLAEFVGDFSFQDALQKFRDSITSIESQPLPDEAKPSGNQSSSPNYVATPLLLWVDDKHSNNNQREIQFAKDQGINVMLFYSTEEIKQWIEDNDEVMREDDPKKIRIITNNVRAGRDSISEINAGENVVRYVRGRRYPAPLLVYCGDLKFAEYTKNYRECSATNVPSVTKKFISDMISRNLSFS